MTSSVVPTTFHPQFVGSLGSGLNASLLRKIQIISHWLDKVFPGFTIRLVQGSPSGSTASGGTHLGPGDAADLELVDASGAAPGLAVRVFVSAMFRLLDCLSYVRGSDVNEDGVANNSFEFHLHVIDREGGNKASAAVTQISQFVAHQNGLANHGPDLEATVNDPFTLATYTDAGFALRLQSLSPAALAADLHVEPQEEPMLTLFKQKGGPIIVVGDGITARHVTDILQLAKIADLSRRGIFRLTPLTVGAEGVVQVEDAAGLLVPVLEVDDLGLAGTLTAPLPPGEF